MSERSLIHEPPKEPSLHKDEESNEHKFLRIETEPATKDHSYRKDKFSYRSDLDLFYKSHSESAHKKDKERFKAFNKDNSEYHDKKEQLKNPRPVKGYSSNGPMNYEQYEKVVKFDKERFTPKERGGKFQFLKRTDSEHSHSNCFHMTKPLSVERFTSTSPLTPLDMRSSQEEVNNLEWSNLLMNSMIM
jgi:hypothetical protein